MVATEPTDRAVADRRHAAVRHGAEGGLVVVERIVEQAAVLQARAPEAALVLAEHAAAMAETAGANELWVRAESLVVQARVVLGHRAPTVGRAVAALRAAEDAEQPVIAAQVRTDLAVCARSVGAPLTGLAVLRPVLTVQGLSSVQRAAALCHLAGCLGTFGRKAELEQVLLEGDRVIGADATLGSDSMLLAKAMVRVGLSAHRRRQGDLLGAADAARTGIGLLEELEDPSSDGGLVGVRLALELVCALLDRGDIELALEVAESVLNQPERAASVAPLSWLRLAVATRIHMVNGAAETAVRMLRDAAYSTGRHGLHALSGRLWLELAHAEERIGQPKEAIQCLHRARVAEQLHARVRSQAHALLTGAFGSGEQEPVNLADIVSSAAHAAAAPQADAPAAAAAASDAPRAALTGRAERAHTVQRKPGVVLPMSRFATQAGTSGAETTSATPESATSGPGVSESAASTTAVSEFVVPESGTARPSMPEPAEQSTTPHNAHTSAAESGSGVVGNTDSSGSAGDPAPTGPTGRPGRAGRRAARKARHDTEHGSIAARSVLDRLGISPSGTGGRRRAVEDDDEPETEAEPEAVTAPETATASWVSEQAAYEDTGAAGDSGPSGGSGPAGDMMSDTSDEYGWLPKLRLPPSLAPLDGFDTDDAQPTTDAPVSQTTGTASTTRDEPAALAESADTEELGNTEKLECAGETSDTEVSSELALPGEDPSSEEPSSEAGLAELLTRALAEHRAGTSSAAALIKRLGVENDEASQINGKHRNDG